MYFEDYMIWIFLLKIAISITQVFSINKLRADGDIFLFFELKSSSLYKHGILIIFKSSQNICILFMKS
jgi:hypothetical protein